jgi:hypothetical protein
MASVAFRKGCEGKSREKCLGAQSLSPQLSQKGHNVPQSCLLSLKSDKQLLGMEKNLNKPKGTI